MKLILKDYIETLKEEIELENLLNNILFLEGFKNIVPAQKGLRQFGVDVKAEKNNEIYLFIIKQKDITRDSWDSNKNSVRATLNEINDVYIPDFIKNKTKVNIILCTNGIIRQEVEINWSNYISRNETQLVKYEFWGINELSNKVSEFLINEYLFGDEFKSDLRKTIYFAGETNNELLYYDNLLNNMMEKINTSNPKNIYKKNLTVYNIIVNVCVKFALDEENNRLAIKMVEKAIIKFWAFIMSNKKYEKALETDILYNLIKLYMDSSRKYINNIEKISNFKPSFLLHNPLEYRILVYECIGLISTYTYLLYFYNSSFYNDEINYNMGVLINILNNNPAHLYPVYDLHSIEINELLILLYSLKDKKESKRLLESLVSNMCYKMNLSGFYPTPFENYDMAVLMDFNDEVEDCRSSVLINNLLEWLVIHNDITLFNKVTRFIKDKFPNICLSSWQIQKHEEITIFNKPSLELGVSYICGSDISFDNVKGVMQNMQKVLNNGRLDTLKYNCEPLFMLLSRHYRIPLLPYLWQRYLSNDN